MIAIPLGKVRVPNPGTSVGLNLPKAQLSQLPPGGLVAKIQVWPDPRDAGIVYVKIDGVRVAAVAFGAHHWSTPDVGRPLEPSRFSIDAEIAGNGPFVTLWVG